MTTEPRPKTDYYVTRAAQERAAAQRTTDSVARRVHLEMADRYDALVAPKTLAL
ncbi:hypothetical protein [uncultured Sphingomonas sp.]|uniref:hypothetical protein n=1 Tax=uncultured Sphingomonas sp. TaxID=158754 RepID=UPI0025F09B98|nr:hypothetical protein [uncultured Sphingomonas sp.]